MKNGPLLKVLIAMALAVAAGAATGPETAFFGVTALQLYDLIGKLFLNALTLVVVPLVAASIITGTARMGSERSFGTLGAKTFGWYLATTLLAVLVGWGAFMALSPGAGLEPLPADPEQMARFSSEAAGLDGTFEKIEQILFKLVPSNILSAASEGQMLGLIFFSLLFGFFIPKIEGEPGRALLGFWRGIFQVMMKMTQLVMRALPIGVFGLVAKVAATTGLEAVRPILLFVLTVLFGLGFYSLAVIPLLLRFGGGVSPLRHFRAAAPALFTAFSTSSTAATLPVTIDCMEKRAGLSNRICSFTVPLAASLNLSGTALYTCVSALFICHVYGVALTLPLQLFIVVMALITSFGMAGIPSASLVTVVMILHTVGLPADGVALILTVERVLDMCRTAVNVYANTCCAVLVARSEGEAHALA